MTLLSEWLAYFPYYSPLSTPLKNASLICIYHMVVSVRYRYNNLLETYRIPSWKFQVDISIHERNTQLDQSVVDYRDYVVSPAIVLPKAEIFLHELLERLQIDEDYLEVKALLERGGIEATKQLLLQALIPSFKDSLAHSCDGDQAYNVLS